MIGAKRLAPAIAALLLTAAWAWSQPVVDAESDTIAPTQNPGSDADSEESTTDTTPTPPTRSPTDYRASEQISEDLSVSFPVDI